MMQIPVRVRHTLAGLALGQLCAMGFLAACVWWVRHDFLLALEAGTVTGSVDWGQFWGGIVGARLVRFILFVLLVHVLFGLAAFGLGRLAMAAFPDVGSGHQGPWIAGSALILGLTVLLANAAWYPASHFSLDTEWFLNARDVAVRAWIALLSVSVALSAILAWRRAGIRPSRRAWSMLLIAGIVIGLGTLASNGALRASASAAAGQPHVVILGVDSLRSDLSEAAAGESLTPQIDAFLERSHQFSDATTSLARTYGSWVSILTGRSPLRTNARFNLMPRTLVHEGDTIADTLRARGYHTIYATDEVRFANIDESFGFDQLITPPIGASDFLIGKISDLPLLNLVADSVAGRWLVPAMHANRGAYVTYEPEDFVGRLEHEVDVAGPTFLAVHLTLAHWPYSWAGQTRPTTPVEYRAAYPNAIREVDRQFASVIRVLESKGILDDAYVILLSDHGEALGYHSDTMLRRTGTAEEIWNSIWGHGTSVMSPHQYRVVLAMRGFGSSELPGAPAVHNWPVSLEDINPTVEQLVTGTHAHDVDGISLQPFIEQPERASGLAARVRYTETDVNTRSTVAGRFDASGLVTEAAKYFEIDPRTGWVQIRPEWLTEFMGKKQRAAMSSEALLAMIPDDSGGHKYLYSDRRDPLPRPLSGRQDVAMDPEGARLWDALHAHFSEEIRPTPGLP